MENNRQKIVVVEDDILMVKILGFILSKEGYDLTIANDGQDAIEKIVAVIPDMVITDITLPSKSGLEVIAFTKENFKSVPVIVLSSMGVEESAILEAFSLGANDFIPKPFCPNELKIRVKRLFIKYQVNENVSQAVKMV